MAFFEKFGETISTKGKEAAQKAKEVADLAKLNAQIGQLEGKIKTWYQVVGEKVYQSEKDQEHSAMEVEFSMITDAFAEIGRLKKQIADIKGLKECPACHAQVDREAQFCPKCGAKLEEEEECCSTEETCCSCEEEACEPETDTEESCSCTEEAPVEETPAE